jgi:hypothetical protein
LTVIDEDPRPCEELEGVAIDETVGEVLWTLVDGDGHFEEDSAGATDRYEVIAGGELSLVFGEDTLVGELFPTNNGVLVT